jgi:integrase
MLKKHSIVSGFLFPDEGAAQSDPNRIYKAWYAYRKQNGIDCSLHELRHTLVSLAKGDVPEQLLKRAIGHTESMDTFGVYGHDVEGDMQRVADLLDGVFDELLK